MIETVEDMVDVFSKGAAKLQERIAGLEHENENLKRLLHNWLVWHEQELGPKPGCLREESEVALQEGEQDG